EYDDDERIAARILPPRHFKLSYLVTAWTQRPEEEHRPLSGLLSCLPPARQAVVPGHRADPAARGRAPAAVGAAVLLPPVRRDPGRPADRTARGTRRARTDHDRVAAAGGPVVRRRVVRARRGAQAVAGPGGVRADRHRPPVRGGDPGDRAAA